MVGGVPVSQLVYAKEVHAPVEVVRVGQRPVVAVEGLIQSGGTARASKDVNASMSAMTLPAGVSWTVTGADAEQQRTTNELLLVAVLATALVFLVLAGEFASFTVPLVVMLTVPLAAAGGLVFLWMTGQSINVVSLIGIVVMIGMADNEAVVKLDAIRRFRDEGHTIEDAILLGGHQRLRAIAMTLITTITGVLPLMFGWGSGGELYQATRGRRHRRERVGVAGDVLPAAYRVCGARASKGTGRGQRAEGSDESSLKRETVRI